MRKYYRAAMIPAQHLTGAGLPQMLHYPTVAAHTAIRALHTVAVTGTRVASAGRIVDSSRAVVAVVAVQAHTPVPEKQ